MTVQYSTVIAPRHGGIGKRGSTVTSAKNLVLALVAVLATPAAAADPKAAAKAAFVARCGMCHQATGDGLAGQFPKLSGRAAAIAQTPAGRRYLARVVLGGMAGPIEIDGVKLNGVMPGMASMSDAEIAEILSHVVTLGKPAKPAKPFKAEDITAARAEGGANMSSNKALRLQMVADGVVK
ncbi:cytochrome c [Sandarakinorhabdus sp.]|jgi:mono/diheme cytochrome c family protein|uniref:c-type cytochrome n=1 Tax=Sandarakinorhabdus sp. TaxID=1916663 RepID=UPI003340FFBD